MTPRLSVKWNFEEEMGYYYPLKLRTLSWNVSPENLGHMAALSSKQETNKALDRGLMHGTNFPEHVRSTGEMTQDGKQRDDSERQGQPFPADEVSNEDTIADRPRLNVAESHLQGSHSRKDDCTIKARNRRFSAGHQSTRPAYPSSIATFLRLVAVREYEGVTRNLPRVQQAPRSSQGYIHPARPTARVESTQESTGHQPLRRDVPRPDPADRPRSIVKRAHAHRRAYAQGRVLSANRRPAEQHDRSNQERRDPAALQPAHARAVGETASQAGSATAQRAVRTESVDALGDREPRSRVSRLLQPEGAAFERERADPGSVSSRL
ncbi:hypothetical protein WN51_06504 [Melipona quadrifasciata]|uniref:Uncharacterized protein n=1 Tax=Melipona quadrifasciata TaxID=166423 RepID=A0A0N1IT38_9HYME|nr:hypothetical protein WN51_06504 [Melipona quadrifasciata]